MNATEIRAKTEAPVAPTIAMVCPCVCARKDITGNFAKNPTHARIIRARTEPNARV